MDRAILERARALLIERGRITRAMTQEEMQEYCSVASK